eukprot:2012705-Prorocentrum_lima.AAC.1
MPARLSGKEVQKRPAARKRPVERKQRPALEGKSEGKNLYVPRDPSLFGGAHRVRGACLRFG